MKVYCIGIDQLTVSALKDAGYSAIVQTTYPDRDQRSGNVVILTSEFLSLENIDDIDVTDCTVLYQYKEKGVRGYQHVETICLSKGIHFISPRATASTITDKIKFIFQDEHVSVGNIIGFFGSAPGVGTTTLAATTARSLAHKGLNVIMLGLNLYDPGYNQQPTVSLDLWRPRLTGKVLQDSDFQALIKIENFHYLPGSFDFLDAQDYQEEEIEYLLQEASKKADIIVADFGAIPESAAWYVGMQKANTRIFVTQPNHIHRMEQIMGVVSHLDLSPIEFLTIMNFSTIPSSFTPKAFASQIGTHLLMEIPKIDYFTQLPIPLGKKDQLDYDKQTNNLLSGLGIKINEESKKKGMLF
ncbi:hypothetical protein [Paenibacillus lutrae]|uniref:AAA domain-containing protein n=1 Tax=Paenibacillus lutrae TaxID=2078573 RepID=A0A7X3FM17_9BACL|nr:hypothetical protein [Paenibacillus lutrae]MVP02130.1 hypothetical protein [Paenibacillus lutrae]